MAFVTMICVPVFCSSPNSIVKFEPIEADLNFCRMANLIDWHRLGSVFTYLHLSHYKYSEISNVIVIISNGKMDLYSIDDAFIPNASLIITVQFISSIIAHSLVSLLLQLILLIWSQHTLPSSSFPKKKLIIT